MSKVKLEVGMAVSCIVNGIGVIDKFSDSDNYPIVGKFNRGLLCFAIQAKLKYFYRCLLRFLAFLALFLRGA